MAVLTVTAVSPPSLEAQTKAASLEEVKARVAKLGTGPKAVVRVTLRDGKKVKGWLSSVAEDDFAVADEKSGAVTTIAYADVAEVKSLKPPKGAVIATVVAGLAATVAIFLFAGAKR
jgi:nitrogenase subunit NifH